MKTLSTSSRVSYASDFNLSQVRLFLSESSKVGMELQNHIHANPSKMSHSNITESNEFPPGFDNNYRKVNMKEQMYYNPLVKWNCPPKIIMSSKWQIVAGEESEEVVVQKLREMRAMEAVYPHNYAVPPCPAVSVGTHDEGYDDCLTPVIPIIPIEEEEKPLDLVSPEITAHITSLLPALPQAPLLTSGTASTSKTTSHASEPLAKEKPVSGMPLGLYSNKITAALTAGVKSDKIDTQLLVQILSDPEMIEKLTKDCGAAAGTRTMTKVMDIAQPVAELQQATKPIPLVIAPTAPALKQPIPSVNPKPNMFHPPRPVDAKVAHFTNGMQPDITTAPAQLATRSVSFGSKPVNRLATSAAQEHNMRGPFPGFESDSIHRTVNKVNPIINMMPGNGMAPNPPLATVKPSNVKDENYYKNLIRQHGFGGDSLKGGSHFLYSNIPNNQYHNLEMMQKLNSESELKPMVKRACAYFNSPRGCIKGEKCDFKHENSVPKRAGVVMEGQYGKRMRLCGEGYEQS